jgi:hypothetical protein
MSGFENYARELREIETEIERKGIALGIDWNDEPQVRALAREAIDHSAADLKRAASHPEDHQLHAKVELFGLAQLMLKTMEETADVGFQTHGGKVWKAFGRALWQEAQLRRAAP